MSNLTHSEIVKAGDVNLNGTDSAAAAGNIGS